MTLYSMFLGQRLTSYCVLDRCDIFEKAVDMQRLKRELMIYLGLFVFLAAGMHYNAWLSHPLEHIYALKASDFGLYHPLFFTLAAYLVIAVLRIFYTLIVKLVRSKQ